MGCAGNKAADDVKGSDGDNQKEKSRRRLSVGNTAEGIAVSEEKADASGKVKNVRVDNVNDIFELFPSERKWSLQGENDISVMKDYQDKKELKHGTITSSGIGHCCKKGMKPESPNQDDFVMLQCGNEFGLYGVFDGHGPAGHDVSNYINRVIPGYVVRDGKFKSDPLEAIKQAFISTHRGIQKQYSMKNFDASMSGATASLAVLETDSDGKHVCHIGHVGDSRCIVGVGATWDTMIAQDITRDHKCELPDEKKRIESSGGIVKKRQGDVPYRVFMKGSNLPGLAMSRSLGDLIAQKVGVSHVPEVNSVPLTGDHQVLILASDGVWEFLSSEQVIQEVKKFSPNDIQKACDSIAALSWKNWLANEFDVVDDITVIGLVLPTIWAEK
jgi:serine/threonine protein phosphatase PrpC